MKRYPILIGTNTLSDVAPTLKKLNAPHTLIVVTQKKIKNLHGAPLAKALKDYDIKWLTIPDGEKYKTLKTCETLLQKIAKLGADRHSLLVAFGGGVVGDITGFAASIYMRGIDYIQIPTTLLSQVDSSVGGKTGVDFAHGKNILGSFYQPKAVFIQTQFLKTLSQKQYLSGLSEVIKTAALSSPRFFKQLETHTNKLNQRESDFLKSCIKECVNFKEKIVRQDEKENNLRAILNFGHTLGHAIESITRYQKFTHGEAVAMGMTFACHLGAIRGFASDTIFDRMVKLLNSVGLPTAWPKFSKPIYRKFLKNDKKRKGETIRFILLKKIGSPQCVDLTFEELSPWL